MTFRETYAGDRRNVSAKIGEELERSDIKPFSLHDFDVEIVSVKKMDGGVEVLARAFSKGRQIGFGPDGSIDIERFRIFNPPTLIPDKNGQVIREVFNPETKKYEIWRYKEDMEEALKQTLVHTINVVKKNGKSIVKGKVGNTTSTFYPDPNVESTSVDGFLEHYSNIGIASQVAAANATGVNDSGTSINGMQHSPDGGGFYNIQRGVTVFDTSAIGTDTITDAVASLYGQFKSNANSYSIRCVSVAPASNTALAVGDWDSFGTTSIANEISLASFTTGSYNDFTLTDLTAVNGSGVTKLGWRLTGEISASTPTGANYAQCASADTAGTSNDPKLVVTHSAASVRRLLLLGIGT